jgi:DNA polymerase-1
MPIVKASRKTGAASVDRSVLMTLAGQNNDLKLVNEWREIQKVKTTYTSNLADKCDGAGRIHASFLQHGTDTGRLSSRNPNLQNIPARHPTLGRRVRQAFVVDDDQSARIYCDYSQIELRLLAWITGCQSLTEAYEGRAYMALLDGRIDYQTYRTRRESEGSTDVHGAVAQSVFSVSPTDPDFKRYRSAAKIINFGVPYGAGPRLLSDNPQLRLSDKDARAFFEQYHQNNPEIGWTKSRLIQKMLGDPLTRFVNWAGRTRHGPKLRSAQEDMRSKAERAMFASLVQGSAAELTRFSIVSIWKAQNRGELPCSSTSTVHDEVQVDCSIHDAKDVAIKVQELMESFTGLFGTIPVVADLEITKTSWANKEEYKP